MSAEKKKTTPLGKSEGAEPERFIPDGMGMFQRNVKRIGDCALAFLALIVFSPLFLLCYALDLHVIGRFHEAGVIIGNGGIPLDDLHGLYSHVSRRRCGLAAAAGNAYQQKESHPDGYRFFLS